jgi:hypothetical protein
MPTSVGDMRPPPNGSLLEKVCFRLDQCVRGGRKALVRFARFSGLEGSRLPEITLKWGKHISDRQVELLQERGESRVAVQALQ